MEDKQSKGWAPKQEGDARKYEFLDDECISTKEEMMNDGMNGVAGDYTTIIQKRLRNNLLRWKQNNVGNKQQSLGRSSISVRKNINQGPYITW